MNSAKKGKLLFGRTEVEAWQSARLSIQTPPPMLGDADASGLKTVHRG
jgi:hypothetical protein